MAKKEKEDSIDEIDDLMGGEIQSVYPEIEEEKESEEIEEEEEIETVEEMELEDELEEDLDFVIEEEAEVPQYKYLDVEIHRTKGKNNYHIMVENQSHGFLNSLVNNLLKLEAVEIAAYKRTNIQTPRIFIKLKEGYKIKKALREGIDLLRNEVVKAQKIYSKLIK
jgi:DNA-directed RNA polymerase subunit L